MSRISVIVPCHDYGDYVGEALASLDGQTRRPDQIVVVDDGSTDDSLEVIRAFAAGRDDVVVLTRHPASGIVGAVADGVAASDGDLFAILSADDRFSPTYLEAGERTLQDPTIDFTWTDTHQFGAVDRWRRAVPSVTRRSIARRCRIHACGMMRRSLWDEVGGYDPAFNALGCEDWEFWVHATALGARGRPAPGAHLDWRRHARASRNTIQLRRVVEIHWALHRRHPRTVRTSDVAFGLIPTLGAFALASLRVRRRLPSTGAARPQTQEATP